MLKKHLLLLLATTLVLVSCKKDPDPIIEEPSDLNTIPEFYQPAHPDLYGLLAPEITIVGSKDHRLNMPQDLGFHPINNQLWVINRDVVITGGSVVIFDNPGQANQSFTYRRDGNARHFMSLPTSMAFSNFGYWATGSGVQDANHSGGTYTGPTLWSGNLDTFARNFGPDANGSHLDMLHGSPFSMGIAHHSGNAYWVFDGYHKHLVFYDFVEDHGPGMHDHSNGRIHRHIDVELNRHIEIPSHMILDKETGWLYISETERGRVLRVNINTGTISGSIPANEPLAEHFEVKGTQWEVFFENNITHPCGIALSGDRIFITDNSNGHVVAINKNTGEELGRLETGKQGLMGITVGPDNKLWMVSKDNHEVYRIDPR